MNDMFDLEPFDADSEFVDSLQLSDEYENFPDLYDAEELFEDAEEQVAAIDVDRAVRLNRYYGRKLGWDAHYDRIEPLLGFRDYSPDEQAFAQAVADWQQSQGLTVDGILGPRTWSRMKYAIGPRGAPARPTGALPQGPFGTLTVLAPARYRFSYEFTPEDVLWLARFIVGEASGKDNLDNRAVIWTMFNRYALFRHKQYRTFHQFIRRYSTTLQPTLRSWKAAQRHMHSRNFVRTGGYYAPPHDNVPRGQLRQFLRLQKRPWSDLPQSARSLAERALEGQVPNPIGIASEFDNTFTYYRQKYGKKPDYEQWHQYTEWFGRRYGGEWIGHVPNLRQMKVNAFFTVGRTKGLPPDTVQVVPRH